jgi:hypothetical protein
MPVNAAENGWFRLHRSSKMPVQGGRTRTEQSARRARSHVLTNHSEESAMGIEQAPTDSGKKAAEGLHESSAAEEREVEAEKGSPLKKGADRFDERARSSDGESAGSKQRM